MASPPDHDFFAYKVNTDTDMPIRPAPLERDWMDDSRNRFAYRCLPLTIANQAGWVIENPVTFTAIWDGSIFDHGVRIRFEGVEEPPPPQAGGVFTVAAGVPGLDPDGPNGRDARVDSHFGSGVITFLLPYLFRTPPSVNLWVKGPSNWIKDGAQALEGIVETDWNPATFTMNWKLTRKNYAVTFKRGEPICMVVPVPRGLAESLKPICAPLSIRPDLQEQCEAWSNTRAEFLAAYRTGDPEAVQAGWQRHYTKGLMPGGAAAGQHQTRLRLKEFTRYDEGTAPPEGATPYLANGGAAQSQQAAGAPVSSESNPGGSSQ